MGEQDLYYTANEAQKVLGFTKATFHRRVNEWNIPTFLPPGKKQRLYPKKAINAIVDALDEAAREIDERKRYIFSKSDPGNQKEEMLLGIRCFGEKYITPLPERIGFQQKSEHTFYSLRDASNHVVAYISMFHFPPVFLDDILTGRKVEHEITVKEVLKFPLHKPFDLYIDVLAVDPALPWRERRLCTRRIVREFANLLLHLVDEGYEIRTVYTVSATDDGDRLISHHFHLMEGKSTKVSRLAYEFHLDEQGIRHLQEMTGRNLHGTDSNAKD